MHHLIIPDFFLAQVHLIFSFSQFDAEDKLVTASCLLSQWRLVVIPFGHAATEALCLDFPGCRLTLAQIGSFEVSLAHARVGVHPNGVHRAKQVSIGAHVILISCHLLKFLSRSIEKGLLDLETQLLKEVYFLIIEVLVVENGKLLHSCFHLSTQT